MQFHLGDVLSVTTGKLCSPSHIDGVYKILDYVFDTAHFTHQLPRAADQAKPILIAQHPFLADISGEKVNSDNVAAWLADQIAQHGEWLDIQPASNPVRLNPLEELANMLR